MRTTLKFAGSWGAMPFRLAHSSMGRRRGEVQPTPEAGEEGRVQVRRLTPDEAAKKADEAAKKARRWSRVRTLGTFLIILTPCMLLVLLVSAGVWVTNAKTAALPKADLPRSPAEWAAYHEGIHCLGTHRPCLKTRYPRVAGRFVSVLPGEGRPPLVLLHVMEQLKAGRPVSWLRLADGDLLYAMLDANESRLGAQLRDAAASWGPLMGASALFIAVNTHWLCIRNDDGPSEPWQCSDDQVEVKSDAEGEFIYRHMWNDFVRGAGLDHRHFLDFFYLPFRREAPWSDFGVDGWIVATNGRPRVLVAPASFANVSKCLDAKFVPVEEEDTVERLAPLIAAASEATTQSVVFLMSAGTLAKVMPTTAQGVGKDSFIDVGSSLRDLHSDIHSVTWQRSDDGHRGWTSTDVMEPRRCEALLQGLPLPPPAPAPLEVQQAWREEEKEEMASMERAIQAEVKFKAAAGVGVAEQHVTLSTIF